jgi:Rhs element Vgr protein
MALASKIRIEIEGQELKDFLNLTINQSIYTFHQFEVVCRMDTFESPDGFVIEQSKKMIGSVITISIGTDLKGKSSGSDHLFKGIITEIRAAKSDTGQADHVILSGHSPDILLNDNPGCQSFENKSLKQIADDVLKPYPKDVLRAKTDPAKSDQFPYIVQYNETRHDFLRRLATRFGEWFYYDGTELHFGKLSGSKTDLKLGIDLTDFKFSIGTNPLKFKYIGYDYTKAEKVEIASSKSGGKNQLNEYGGYAHDKSMKQYSQESILYYNHLNTKETNVSKELSHVVSLEEGASALNMSAMQGSSQNPELKLGSRIDIKALKGGKSGQVDYGEYIITTLIHSCDNTMNYQNSFEGIPGEAKIPDYTNPKAIPNCETQTAEVKDNNDPDKLGRVRVNFHWLDGNLMSPWLRVANAYSGADIGFYFIPEVGDEVLVGFEGGNAEKPYVMGSMYHGKNKPAGSWPNQDNNFKGILTRSKLKIEFDEEKKITTIDTPGGNQVVLSDDDKYILLKDQNQNKVELGSGGIIMDSPKDIKITSKSKVSIEGTGGVDISSTADAKVSGLNINLDANASLAVKGKASAELSSVGNTTVNGTMVMIN